MPDKIDRTHLAACGVNCALCKAHLDGKTPCVGCLGDPANITRKSCISCKKKACAKERGYTHCFECEQFPCADVRRLDKTYRERYGVSLIENGEYARDNGIDAFMARDRERYACTCGGIICAHDGICTACGKAVINLPNK